MEAARPMQMVPTRGSDVLHGVVDRETGVDRPPRRVDVQPDVLLGVLTGQEEQLGHDHVGHLVVDGGADEDDPVLEQAGVDVHPALTPVGGLDDVGDEVSLPGQYTHGPSPCPQAGCEARTNPLRRSGVPRPDRLGQASEPSPRQGIADTDGIKYIDTPG